MSRMVHCNRLGREAAGLDSPPLPGELGQRIYDCISREAWDVCKQQMTMIINEYQLHLANPEVQAKLMDQIEEFLFGEGGAQTPPDYVPPASEPASEPTPEPASESASEKEPTS